MLTPERIAFYNITKQRFRSVVFFILIAVSSACIFGAGLFNENIGSAVGQVKGRIGADLIVVPSGYNDNAKDALFAGDACTIFFKSDPSQIIAGTEGAASVSPQMYLETLSLDCCSAAGIQIIAVDPATDFSVSTWTDGNSISDLGVDELIAGAACGLRKGDTITFFDHEFLTTEVLEETGMGYDNSIFVSFETARQITASEKYAHMFGQKTDLVSMILVNAGKDSNIYELAGKLRSSLSDAAIYSTDDLVSELKKQAGYFRTTGFIADMFTVILSSVAIFALITLTFYQRRNRIGSLLSVGVSKSRIVKIYLLEYFYLTFAGTVSGIGVTAAVLLPMHGLIKRSLDIPYRFAGTGQTVLLSLLVLAVNLVMLASAYSFAFFKIMKTEPAVLMEEHT